MTKQTLKLVHFKHIIPVAEDDFVDGGDIYIDPSTITAVMHSYYKDGKDRPRIRPEYAVLIREGQEKLSSMCVAGGVDEVAMKINNAYSIV